MRMHFLLGALLATAPVFAQEQGSTVQTGDRVGTFVAVDTHIDQGVPLYWLNLSHLHSIEMCPTGPYPRPPCLFMDGSGQASTRHRVFPVPGLSYAEAVRAILQLPNPTTPTATITVQAVLTVGEPATLTANVVDPDYGDSWTYAWSVSTAARIAGEFSATDEATVEFTPTAAVETGLFRVVVTDHAGQSVTATSEIVRVQEPSGG